MYLRSQIWITLLVSIFLALTRLSPAMGSVWKGNIMPTSGEIGFYLQAWCHGRRWQRTKSGKSVVAHLWISLVKASSQGRSTSLCCLEAGRIMAACQWFRRTRHDVGLPCPELTTALVDVSVFIASIGLAVEACTDLDKKDEYYMVGVVWYKRGGHELLGSQ